LKGEMIMKIQDVVFALIFALTLSGVPAQSQDIKPEKKVQKVMPEKKPQKGGKVTSVQPLTRRECGNLGGVLEDDPSCNLTTDASGSSSRQRCKTPFSAGQCITENDPKKERQAQ
jgi:hypothetical protein